MSDGVKVFSIGFNKTGTSSLHQFYLRCGLRSLHDVRWPVTTWLSSGKNMLADFDAYSDGEHCNFRQLKLWFPSSVIVLNTRNERDWLRSRVKHVLRMGNFSCDQAQNDPRLGKMAREFFTNGELAIRKWQLEKRLYELQVRNYFSQDLTFLEIDVTTMQDWQVQLSRHLINNGVVVPEHVADIPIHANQRENSVVTDQQLLTQMFEVIEGLILYN